VVNSFLSGLEAVNFSFPCCPTSAFNFIKPSPHLFQFFFTTIETKFCFFASPFPPQNKGVVFAHPSSVLSFVTPLVSEFAQFLSSHGVLTSCLPMVLFHLSGTIVQGTPVLRCSVCTHVVPGLFFFLMEGLSFPFNAFNPLYRKIALG